MSALKQEGEIVTERAGFYGSEGGPEVLYVDDVEVAAPGAGEILLRVEAAGLNPVDAKFRSGFIPLDLPFPRRVGSDATGRVVAVGEGAEYVDGSPVDVGDEVVGWADGTIATTVVVPARQLARRPGSISVDAAGGIAVVGLTALAALRTIEIGEADVVLVGGAAGAVGTVYSQLAIAAGSRVIGTASPRHHEFLRSIGVEPVEYGAGVAARVRDAAAPDVVTAVFDMHGRDALDAGVELGVARERMSGIAAYAAVGELGVLPFPRYERRADDLAWIVEEVAAGRVVVPVAATFPLASIVEAFRALEAPHDPGKIIVRPQRDRD